MKRRLGISYQSGYRMIKAPAHPRADSRDFVMEHILVAEKALGRYLPAGSVIHHVDEIKDNNANSNLVICEDRNYHALIHVRLRIVRHGGDPDVQKICGKCHSLKLHIEFGKDISRRDGLRADCRHCTNADFRLKYWQDDKCAALKREIIGEIRL